MGIHCGAVANIYDGAFLSSNVINEISQKYENVQKGVGDIMGGALLEPSTRTILNQGKSQGIS